VGKVIGREGGGKGRRGRGWKRESECGYVCMRYGCKSEWEIR